MDYLWPDRLVDAFNLGFMANIIHKMDYTKYPQGLSVDEDFDFYKYINLEELNNFVNSLPIDEYGYLHEALLNILGHIPYPGDDEKQADKQRRYQRAFIHHCDTQEMENSWRVQLKINLQGFPEAAQLLIRKGNYLANLEVEENNAFVVLTFTLNKITVC